MAGLPVRGFHCTSQTPSRRRWCFSSQACHSPTVTRCTASRPSGACACGRGASISWVTTPEQAWRLTQANASPSSIVAGGKSDRRWHAGPGPSPRPGHGCAQGRSRPTEPWNPGSRPRTGSRRSRARSRTRWPCGWPRSNCCRSKIESGVEEHEPVERESAARQEHAGQRPCRAPVPVVEGMDGHELEVAERGDRLQRDEGPRWTPARRPAPASARARRPTPAWRRPGYRRRRRRGCPPLRYAPGVRSGLWFQRTSLVNSRSTTSSGAT